MKADNVVSAAAVITDLSNKNTKLKIKLKEREAEIRHLKYAERSAYDCVVRVARALLTSYYDEPAWRPEKCLKGVEKQITNMLEGLKGED